MNKDFVVISNHEVYCKLLEIESLVKQINGKVKLNRWIAATALSISFLALGFIAANL